MKTSGIFPILLVLIFTFGLSFAVQGEVTEVTIEEAISMDHIDDGTCKNISSKFCCHQGYPYVCRVLKSYLSKGKCRTSKESVNWINCAKVSVRKKISESNKVDESKIVDESKLPAIDDGTCARDDKFGPEYSCHQGNRYKNASFLKRNFDAGRCVNLDRETAKKVGRKQKWVKCSSLNGYNPYRVAGPTNRTLPQDKLGQGQDFMKPKPIETQKPELTQENPSNSSATVAVPTPRPSRQNLSEAEDGQATDAVTNDFTSNDVAELATSSLKLPKVVCTESTGLFMRDKKLDYIKSDGDKELIGRGSEVTQVSDEERPKGKYNFVNIQLADKRKVWVAKEFLASSKEKCPILTRKSKPKSTARPKTARGMFKMPRKICHSWAYNKPSSGNEDYIHPATGCAFIAGLQAWYKEQCPEHRAGCTVRRGDISHPTRQKFDGHSTHTHGRCIDIRPFTKSHTYNPTSIGQSNYSRATTKKFLEHMKKFGADLPGSPPNRTYFNDSAIKRAGLTRHAGGHHNHIHLCMSPGQKVNSACKNFKPDYNVCPEAGGIMEYLKDKGLR